MNRITVDGWTNFVVGLGKKMDKRKYTYFKNYVVLDDEELSRMYIGDGLGSKIVDTVADDMTRQWISLKDDKDDKIKDHLDRLKAECKYNEALKWQRLFGGSIIFIGAMDGREPSEPLNINTLKNIEFLMPIDRSDIDIATSTFYEDPKDPNFGKIESYRVYLQKGVNQFDYVHIHSSRTVEFKGKLVPKRMTNVDQELKYWGASALQSIWEDLRDMGGVKGSVANILYEFIIGKYKFENLNDMLAIGNEDQLINRMEIINMTKSIINAVLLGEGEDYTRDTANVGGLADIMDRFMIFLSASTGIPVSRLFGRTPSGLSTDDESGTRTYYDMVASEQKNKLKPPLYYLIELLSKIENMEPPTIEFNPLMQMTEKEEAEMDELNAKTELTRAETAMKYVEMGALSAEEVRAGLEKRRTKLLSEEL